MTVLTKVMPAAIVLHQSPVCRQTKIADVFKHLRSSSLIVKDEAPLFQRCYLFDNGERLFGIFHIKKPSRPGALFFGKRGGNYPSAKVRCFTEMAKQDPFKKV